MREATAIPIAVDRPGPPTGAVLADTGDCAEFEQAISTYWASARITAQPGSKPARARLWRSFLGSTAVDTVDFGRPFDYTAAPPEKIILARIHTGTWELRDECGSSVVFEAGRTAAFGVREGEPCRGTNYRSSANVFLIDRGLLGQVAVDTPPTDDPPRLTGSAPVSATANTQLVAAMDYVCDAMANNAESMRYPLIAAAAQRYLAASVLAAFPNTAALEIASADPRDTAPVLLRRAITFIDENAHTDITLADIAAAVYITPRAMQYMFRKHRDCTPMEYVRQVRLHHAHLDLAAGDHTATTVGDVARRWGFGHLGRFALRYRMTYGESPHTTLHG